LNKVKQTAATKFQSLKNNLEAAEDEAQGEELDLTAPPSFMPLGITLQQ